MEDKKYTNIDEYVSSFPTDIQKILQNLRQVIHAAAPEAQEVISYSMPAFKLNGILVYSPLLRTTSAFSRHLQASLRFKKNCRRSIHPKAPSDSPSINQFLLISSRRSLNSGCKKI